MYNTNFSRADKVALTVIGLILMALISIVTLSFMPHQARANGQVISLFDNVNNSNQARATTTPTYMLSAGATTTVMTMNTSQASNVNLNLFVTASSTSSALAYSVQVSNDGINWYEEDTATIAGSISTDAPNPLYHSWTPATTTGAYRNVKINVSPNRYTRVQARANSANLSLYAQGVVLNQIPN